MLTATPADTPSSSARNTSTQADPFKRALENNKAWSTKLKSTSPDFLPTLAKSQAPKILWIGCSDSRVPAETITGLSPGELFVHRNIANVLNPTDISSLAVIEYACTALKVQHIVVCGHKNCGGVGAAMGNKKLGKIDIWLSPLRTLRMQNTKTLEALSEPAERVKKLVDLNVRNGVEVLRENSDVMQAQKDRGLQIHGVVYNLETGELEELDCTDDAAAARTPAFELS